MFRKLLVSTLFVTWCLPAGVQGEVLLIDTIRKAPENSRTGLSRPVRGMSMREVEETYGEPTRREPPVGSPPITRWVYDGYSVYFEDRSVLHSVVDRPQPPRQP